MISVLQAWIFNKIAVGGFSTRRDIYRFAFTRALGTTAAAVLLNTAVYQIFGRLGLLGVVIPPNVMLDTIVTAVVAGPISLFAFYLVGSAIHDLAISRNAFEQLSRTDPLTGLMNRRAFVDVIAALDTPYTLVLFDIDRFKAINDTHGHAAGDNVLVDVAVLLQDAFGSTDTVARLGGEEFGVVLRHESKEEALHTVNLFRENLAARTFESAGSGLSVTISAGVSQGNSRYTYSMLLTNADRALYLAKASGRNRVVHADDLAGLYTSQDNIPDKIAV